MGQIGNYVYDDETCAAFVARFTVLTSAIADEVEAQGETYAVAVIVTLYDAVRDELARRGSVIPELGVALDRGLVDDPPSS